MPALVTSHPSVAALLAAHPDETDPRRIMRRLAREKVEVAKAQGWEGPPFCPKELASIFGIRCREVDHDIGGEGRILRQPDGCPLIEYARGVQGVRQRFTIFHELAHTFFPDYCEYVRHIAPGKILTPQEKQFENLCDIAAAEMLFAEPEFTRDLHLQVAADLAVAHQLADRYPASLDATIRRILENDDRAICAAAFLTDQKGVHAGDGPLWVQYSVLHAKFKPFIWPGSMPPAASVALHCYRDGGDLVGPVIELWSIRASHVTWRVQATKLPAIPGVAYHPKVVAFFSPSN